MVKIKERIANAGEEVEHGVGGGGLSDVAVGMHVA